MEQLVLNPGLGTSMEKALSDSVGGINSCGGGTIIMFVMLLLAISLIVYLVMRNQKTVAMVLNALLKKEDVDAESN